MPDMENIGIEIFKNNTNINTINETIDFKSNSLQDYVNTLRTIQKKVNVELTKVVDQDKMDYTAADEDILTNSSYIQKGIVIDKLMKALIVSNIDYNDLISGDRNAVINHYAVLRELRNTRSTILEV